MNKTEISDRLNEFNKFADELFNLSFVKKLTNSGCTLHWNNREGFKTELRGPDDESIKAFINDIRRFFQKGDDVLKIHKLIPIYKSNFVDESEKKIFNDVMRDLDIFSKKSSDIAPNGENITNGKIFEVFLYGRFSHRTKGIKEIHDLWEQMPEMYMFLKNRFIIILHRHLIYINNIVYANKQILTKFKSIEDV